MTRFFFLPSISFNSQNRRFCRAAVHWMLFHAVWFVKRVCRTVFLLFSPLCALPRIVNKTVVRVNWIVFTLKFRCMNSKLTDFFEFITFLIFLQRLSESQGSWNRECRGTFRADCWISKADFWSIQTRKEELKAYIWNNEKILFTVFSLILRWVFVSNQILTLHVTSNEVNKTIHVELYHEWVSS